MAPDDEHWSKAPNFTNDPDFRARVRAETAQDHRAYLEHGLQPTECHRCGLRVRVKKNSAKHTSVQWGAGSTKDCAEFAERLREGYSSAQLDGCPDLQASIQQDYANGAFRHDPE